MAIDTLNAFMQKHMSLLVIAAAILAFFCPTFFIWTAPKISLLLGIVMLGMGMMLRFEDFRTILRRPKDVLIGVLLQYAIMPILALILVGMLNLPPDLAIGVLLVGSCPGGTASNVITYLAKGDIALSVTITMATTLLAPLVTPLLMFLLADARIAVDFFSMMWSICTVVILPILLGLTLNRIFSKYIAKYLKYFPIVSILAIVIIVGSVVAVNAAKILEVGLLVAFVVVMHNIFGFAFGYVAARCLKLDSAKVKTLAIEVGMQNSGLAVSLAMTHFTPIAALPGALFSVWHNIAGSLFASYLARKE